jgi:hypothetical protein
MPIRESSNINKYLIYLKLSEAGVDVACGVYYRHSFANRII